MSRTIAITAWIGLLSLALAASLALRSVLDFKPGPNEFSIQSWETRYFLHKWLYGFGRLLSAKPTLEQENQHVSRFLALNSEINDLERQLSDAGSSGGPTEALATDLASRRHERDGLSSEVAATFEGRVTAIAKREGLSRKLGPFFLLWPPVDLEFATPPRTLAASRRDKIELTATTTLRPGLALTQVDQIEKEAERRPNVSALSFRLDGLGAYPTINEYPTNYRDAIALAAHEWTHNYLFFRPLGLRYYDSYDLRTINETVANTVGNEIAAEVVASWPLEAAAPLSEWSPASQNGFDLGAELRKLRGEVDGLLAAGNIDEAEALMEQRRQDFAASGYRFRKLNQAYFAFTNLYAGATGNTGVTNPIGPKVDEVRKRAGSLGEFVRVAGNIKSAADLDRALARLQ